MSNDYVVRSVDMDGDDPIQYYSIDRASGGCSYWSSNLSSAELMSKDHALRLLRKYKSNEGRTDDTAEWLFPTTELHMFLCVSFQKLKARKKMQVVKVVFEPIWTEVIEGEIKKK